MSEFLNAISSNVIEIIIALLGVAGAWLGTKIKEIYQKYANTKTKQEIVKVSVQWVEQMAKVGKVALEDRLTAAKTKALKLLTDAGITITDEELETIIESTVYSFTNSLNSTDTK